MRRLFNIWCAVVRKLPFLCVVCVAYTSGLGVVSVAAQSKVPTPEFAVEMNFQFRLAGLLAEGCANLTFDYAGFDRHTGAMIAQYSNRGVHSRNISKFYAQVSSERYTPYFTAFQEKYDLTSERLDKSYCAAGVAEAEWRTPIWQMLKVQD